MQPDFKHIVALFDKINATVAAMPQRVAVIAVNFSKDRFVKKNWLDTKPEPWKKTKKTKGSTLVASGRLKRSIRKVRVGPDYAVIGTDVPYAKAHNDGAEISGTEYVRGHRRRAHTRKRNDKTEHVKSHTVKPYSRKYHRKFARRQFVGKSERLEAEISEFISDQIDRVVKGK